MPLRDTSSNTYKGGLARGRMGQTGRSKEALDQAPSPPPTKLEKSKPMAEMSRIAQHLVMRPMWGMGA